MSGHVPGILVILGWIVPIYFLAVNTIYAGLLFSASAEMWRHRQEVRGERLWRVLSSPVAPGISLLAPAFNEAATIITSVQAFLGLRYPNLEVVVVNDGSIDGTLDILVRSFDLQPIHTIYWKRLSTQPVRGLYRSRRYPSLIVVDKVNGGKADALNAGLNLASGELVCTVDADTLIEPDALQRMVRPFLSSDDILAVGGTIRVANGSVIDDGYLLNCRVPHRLLPGVQVVEYLRAFLFGRLGWNKLGGNLIISGAFGLFRRAAVIDTGGYSCDTVGEDMELVLRLRRHGYETGGPHRVDFIPDPVAWTEGPSTIRVLGRQRDRWHRGLADVLWRHRRLFLNPRYGAMGLIVYPYFLLGELVSPLAEGLGLAVIAASVLFGFVGWTYVLLFFLSAYGYGLILTTTTLVLEEVNYHRYEGALNRLWLVLWALTENLGYRQLTVFWRMRGLVGWLRRRGDWGTMDRRGLAISRGNDG